MASITKELGETGLKRWGGVIEEDFLREWRGIEAYKRADEMRSNSAVVGALLLAIKQSVKRVDWNITSDSGEEDERLSIIQESMDNLETNFEDHVSEALTFLAFGYSLFEIVYKRSGSRILWKKFSPRSQDTVIEWGFDDNGKVVSFTQQAPPKYKTVVIPMTKVLHYKTDAEKGNPEGRSILRTAWKSYYYSKNMEQIEGIGMERDLAGLPVITLPENHSPEDETKANETVRRIRRDEQDGIVKPAGWEFELLSSGGSRQFDTDKIINRYESRILMSCLAQFLMLGQERSGSYSLSKDQTDLFVMSVNTIADIITDTINKQAISPLLRMNGYDPKGVKMEHTPAGDIDIMEIADFLQKMGAKITWTAKDEVWARGLSGMLEMTPEEIDAEREANRQRDLEKQQLFIQSRQPQDNTQMGADLFQTGAVNENDSELRRFERNLGKNIRQYQEDAKKRIVKSAKEQRNANRS